MGSSSIKLWFLCILGVSILSPPGFLPESHALEIKVKKQARVTGDKIYLGEISSFDPPNDVRVARLSRIEVSSAPSPGNMFQLSKRFLGYKITSAIPEREDITLDLPGSLTVQRAAQYMSASQLEDIFKEHVVAHSPWPAGKIDFERINTPGTIALPEGALHWDVSEKGNHHYLGNVALLVNFSVDGTPIRKLPLSGKISVKRHVVKAARKIIRGQSIREDDLILIEESSDRLNTDFLSGLDEVAGKRAVRTIQPGQFVTSRMVECPPLVRKGERVVIKAENEIITATTIGKALEDGRAGEQVRVMNTRSGKELLATVKAPALVEVSF